MDFLQFHLFLMFIQFEWICENRNLFKTNKIHSKRMKEMKIELNFYSKSKLSLNERKMKNDEESSTINDLISLKFNN